MGECVTVRYKPNGAVHVVPEDCYRETMAMDPDYELITTTPEPATAEAPPKRKR
jgi:hypothetical protein